MENNETITNGTTEVIQTVLPEKPNQTEHPEEVKKGSKWLRKYIIIGATVATALAAAFGITEYLKNSKNEILSPEDINRPKEHPITTETSSALVANLDNNSQQDLEGTSTEWGSNWDDEEEDDDNGDDFLADFEDQELDYEEMWYGNFNREKKIFWINNLHGHYDETIIRNIVKRAKKKGCETKDTGNNHFPESRLS